MESKRNNPIILFDGECILCNTIVGHIIKNDFKKIFVFVALQSEHGQKILNDYSLDQKKNDTIILIEKCRLFIKSDAVFRIIKHISGFWKILIVFQILPKAINDYIYDLVSRNRYKIFGKLDHCFISDQTISGK